MSKEGLFIPLFHLVLFNWSLFLNIVFCSHFACPARLAWKTKTDKHSGGINRDLENPTAPCTMLRDSQRWHFSSFEAIGQLDTVWWIAACFTNRSKLLIAKPISSNQECELSVIYINYILIIFCPEWFLFQIVMLFKMNYVVLINCNMEQ